MVEYGHPEPIALYFPQEIDEGLGPVEIHREFMTAAAMWIMAAKL
jgi:hypothetical protein